MFLVANMFMFVFFFCPQQQGGFWNTKSIGSSSLDLSDRKTDKIVTASVASLMHYLLVLIFSLAK